MFHGFEIEDTSDAMCSVELKKICRDMQKEKRRMRKSRLMEATFLINNASAEEVPPMLDLKNSHMQISENLTGQKSPAEKSPLNKSKTGKFEDSKKKPVLRKTSTMVRSPKPTKKQSDKLVSSRINNKFQSAEHDQSNDYGYASPGISGGAPGVKNNQNF